MTNSRDFTPGFNIQSKPDEFQSLREKTSHIPDAIVLGAAMHPDLAKVIEDGLAILNSAPKAKL